MILAIRTDKPEAELHLLDAHGKAVAEHIWQAGNQLSLQILDQIRDLLAAHGKKMDDVTGILVFRGPGSFTGLRIGIAVANSLAHGLGVAIAGSAGDDWLSEPSQKIEQAEPSGIVVPLYGSEPNISAPKK